MEIYTFSDLLVVQADIHHANKTIEQLIMQFDQLAFDEFYAGTKNAGHQNTVPENMTSETSSLCTYVNNVVPRRSTPRKKDSKSRRWSTRADASSHLLPSERDRSSYEFFATSEMLQECKTETKVSQTKNNTRINQAHGRIPPRTRPCLGAPIQNEPPSGQLPKGGMPLSGELPWWAFSDGNADGLSLSDHVSSTLEA